MAQKRQLAEEEYDVSPKHLKLEHSCELVPFFQSDKDEACFFKPIIGVDHGFLSGNFTDLSVCTSSWASSTTSEEGMRSDAPLQTPDSSPLRPRTLIQPEDAYSYLLGRPPLKEVPIGPEHQAYIPEWHPNGEDELKFMGSCVIPMPGDSAGNDNDTVGRGRTDCFCTNPGSVRCVQQHIKESRETLEGSIGHKRFADLGFGNMGEVVADRWTEEDEQLFHEVVYSNPASVGRNFWNHLAEAFPSHTNQEIVSYYFNVFVLRRRADQNRCDPMNVDSDDDEWQGSEGSEEEIHQYDSYEHGDGNGNHISDSGTPESESEPRKLHNSCSFDSSSQPSEKTMVDETGDHDFQYDSCTSSDTSEFIFEHSSDSKVWDIGYFSCSRTKTDFLPTGSMIEEVFGVGSWNFEVTDDVKSSN